MEEGRYHFLPAAPAVTFDARGTWSWLVAAASIHRSQFTPEQIAALEAVPPEERRVWLSPASDRVLPAVPCP
jgi:hypothetical protein